MKKSIGVKVSFLDGTEKEYIGVTDQQYDSVFVTFIRIIEVVKHKYTSDKKTEEVTDTPYVEKTADIVASIKVSEVLMVEDIYFGDE